MMKSGTQQGGTGPELLVSDATKAEPEAGRRNRAEAAQKGQEIMTEHTDTTQEALRIVTRQRGSWKWQDAYGVVRYTVHTTRDGRHVWKSTEDVVRKASMPELRRMGWGHLPVGSLHHVPVS